MNELVKDLVLQTIFLELVKEGVALSMRDYLDALAALQLGFGQHDRKNLLRLCRALWIRSDREARLLELLFERIPPPTKLDVRQAVAADSESAAEDLSDSPATKDLEQQTSAATASGRDPNADELGAQFAQASAAGIPLVRALKDPVQEEQFIFTEQPTISLRDWIVALRRFRRPLRTGPRTELDIDATVREQCREGFLRAPALIARRRNQARLVILIDASPSMVPWQSAIAAMCEALASGRLGSWCTHYFDNVPEKVVFADATFQYPKPLLSVLDEWAGSSLLVVSDGGAARGFKRSDRIESIGAFIVGTSRRLSPIVWLNPMPRERWKGTSADAIGVPSFQLNEDELIRAVDVLRGRRTQ